MTTRLPSRENILLASMFFMLVLLTFAPIFHTGFTTADDAAIYSATENDFLFSYKKTGRLPHILSGALTKIVALYPNHTYRRVLAVAPQIVVVFLFYLCVLKLTDKRFAVFSALIVLIGIQNAWGHHTVTAFIFVHHMGFIFFLLSLYALIVSLQKSDLKLNIISGVLFFLSISIYELFLPFIGILILVTVLFYLDSHSILSLNLWAGVLKYSSPILIFTFIYLALYIYHLKYGVHYEYSGTKISLSFDGFFKVLKEWSLSAVPGAVFNHTKYVEQYAYEGLETYHRDYRFILSHLDLRWFLRGFIALILALLFFPVIQMKKRPDLVKIAVIVLILALAVFGSNILHALSIRSQQWAMNGTLMFSGTYYSLFGLALIYTLLIALVNGWLNRIRQLQSPFKVLVAAVSIFSVSILTSYSNQYIGKVQIEDNVKWRFVESFFQTDKFKEIPPEAIIFAPSLWESGRFWGLLHNYAYSSDYWSRFLRIKTGSNRQIIGGDQLKEFYLANQDKPFYFARYYIPQNGTPKIIIGQISDMEAALNGTYYSNKFYIYANARSPHQGFYIKFRNKNTSKDIYANSIFLRKSFGESQEQLYFNSNPSERTLSVEITIVNGEVDLSYLPRTYEEEF